MTTKPAASTADSNANLQRPVEVVHVNWLGRDEVEIRANWQGGKLVGLKPVQSVLCESATKALAIWMQSCLQAGQVLEGPLGQDHASMLVREVSLRLRNEFRPPYTEEEICHCRVISTAQVDRAVIAGCQSAREVAGETTASTSCGTCRPDLEAWIRFRYETR
jgi:bacterioferritin-associated ferredoxin